MKKIEKSKQLCINNNSYKILRKLGSGSYGNVYMAQDKNKRRVAIKEIKCKHEPEGIDPVTLRELNILMDCDHPNIIRMIEFQYVPKGEAEIQLILKDSITYIVLEYMELNLNQFLTNLADLQHKLDLVEIKTIFKKIVQGVDYLHQNYIMHRDLKPINIMINPETLSVKLIDFGLSRQFHVPFQLYSREIGKSAPFFIKILRKQQITTNIRFLYLPES